MQLVLGKKDLVPLAEQIGKRAASLLSTEKSTPLAKDQLTLQPGKTPDGKETRCHSSAGLRAVPNESGSANLCLPKKTPFLH